MTKPPAPPYDAQLRASLDAMGGNIPTSITPEMIPALRGFSMPGMPSVRETLIERGFTVSDEVAPGYRGEPVEVSIIRPPGQTGTGPGLFHVHGGGMIIGDRWAGILTFLDWAIDFSATIVTVEYRLAPEHPDPVPLEDAYGALVWTAQEATRLNIDRERLLLAGASAGAGIAAGVALLARDRRGPSLCGQLLMFPMLDDRDLTPSTLQFDGLGTWDRTSNSTGWNALLGDRRGGTDVSIYTAPARAQDLSGLPPAYIDCGSADLFRDEDVAYASGIWAAGGDAELHIWAGGFHGYEGVSPDAVISQATITARGTWLKRLWGA